MIQPLFEHRTSLAGYQTRVLELEGDGPPLVFFHGYADSADTWRPTLALLGRLGRRAIALDLPGFGQASPLLRGPILPQLDEFANAATRYVDQRGRTPVVAVGNSLGGAVALRLAERHGKRLAGVVTVAPAGLEMSRWLSLIERDPVLHAVMSLPTPVPGALLEAAVSAIYQRLAFATPSLIDRRVIANFTGHLRQRAVAASYLDIAHRLVAELHSPFALERITCPVLVVWGDRDRLVFHHGARTILDTVPGARLELLPGVGHCPQLEAPERFGELLLDFSDVACVE